MKAALVHAKNENFEQEDISDFTQYTHPKIAHLWGPMMVMTLPYTLDVQVKLQMLHILPLNPL